MALLNFYRAMFYDSAGASLGKQSFKRKNPTFKFQSKAYNYDSSCKTFNKKDYFGLWSVKTYYYNVNNPFPLVFTSMPSNSQITPEQLNIILESDALKKLNSIKSNWLEKIDFKVIAIAIVLLLVGYYIFKGGSLTK